MKKTLQVLSILLTISVGLQNCVRTSYTCNYGNCQEVRSGGQYETYQACSAGCSGSGGAGYDCVAGSCVSVTSGATYSSQTACQQSCGGGGGATGYNCVNGNCVYVTSGAAYSTLSGCQSNCAGNCNYTTYPNSGTCSQGYADVTSTACCPTSSPYYCSETNGCYTSCAAADAACSSAGVVKADVGGGGGNSGYNCVSGTCTYVSSGATYSSLSSCQSACGSGNCSYTTYPNSGTCGSGYSDVSSTACCPNSSPYYCSQTSGCYATCAAADAACTSAGVVKADVSGGGGGSGYNCVSGSCTYVSSGATYATLSDCQSSCASSGCPYSMNGVWTRMTNTNGCGGIKITFNGTGGSVTSTVSGCCWWNGAVKWHSYNATDCTVMDRTIQTQTCADMGYGLETIYWNGPNDITVGGINYVR